MRLLTRWRISSLFDFCGEEYPQTRIFVDFIVIYDLESLFTKLLFFSSDVFLQVKMRERRREKRKKEKRIELN
jgi:hypothetical protein